MRTAIVQAGMAGAIWGAVIAVPSLIPDVNPVVISCVRFMLYGAFATLLALPYARALHARLTRRDCLLLLELAFTGNLAYFILLSTAVQYAGVPIASLINGLIPVAIMLMGRRHSQAGLATMLCALALILAGILWINLPAVLDVIDGEASPDRLVGALCAALGVLSWSWFALRNAQLLKSGRYRPREWSTLLGISTGLVAVLASFLLALLQPQLLPLDLPAERIWAFIAASLFLAIAGSWIANALWNASAQYLPVALSGQMIVFETLCALLYGYLLAWALPSGAQALGIALILGGVFWIIRAEGRGEPPTAPKSKPTKHLSGK